MYTLRTCGQPVDMHCPQPASAARVHPQPYGADTACPGAKAADCRRAVYSHRACGRGRVLPNAPLTRRPTKRPTRRTILATKFRKIGNRYRYHGAKGIAIYLLRPGFHLQSAANHVLITVYTRCVHRIRAGYCEF